MYREVSSVEKNWKEETKAENAGRQSIGYDLLSLYRSELMGLAILCVIMFHAVNLGLPMPVLNIVWSHGFLGVDIFILLSSMGLSLSLSRRKQNLREFYTRRLIRILPAYWLVAGCCGLFLRKVGETGFEGMFWTLSTLSLWLRHPELNYFDWYIPALLVLYLVMPLCYTLLKRAKYRLSVCAVFYILSIAISSRMPYVMDLSSLIYRIPTFMLGIVIGLYIAEGRVLTIPKMLLWGAGLIAAPILRELLAQVGISLSDWYCFTLYGVFVCLTIACLLWYLPEKGLRSFLRIIGESSLEIYLFNMVLIVLHSHLVNLLPFGASQVSYHVIVITADILLGLGLHRLLQPVTKWLTAKLCPAELNSDYKFLFQASPDPDWTKKKRNCFWAWNLSWVLASGFMVGIFALLLAPGPGNSDMVKNLFRDVQVLALNILPILFLNLILYALIRRAWAAFSINAVIVLGFSVVNYFKIMIRDDPLMFADLFQFKEAQNIIDKGNYKLSLDSRLIVVSICAVAIAVFLYYLVRGRPQRVGVLSGAALFAGILGLTLLTPKLMDVELYQKINAEKWMPTRDYVSHGFVYPFIHSITDVIETPPPGYNEEETASLLNAYPEADIPDEKKVNVIAVMLEAYNDFSKFDVPGLSPDVYKVWHDLEEEGYSGDLVTNIFAGGTTDTERCFLTGYLEGYNFRSSINAYPWYFRSQGYRVEGFHPYYRWYYNRENVTSFLGFEKYYFNDDIETFATNPWTSDGVFFDEILKAFQDGTVSGQPYFSYSLSFQGHNPYVPGEYDWGKVCVTDDGIYTEEQRGALEDYFGSIASTNESLRKFTDSLRADAEPVILILFGDHNPSLGAEIYSAMGINLDTSTEEGFRNYYSTRYIIWANDAAKEILGNDFSGEGPAIGPYFLMNQVFELCGWRGPSYLQALNDISEEVQVVNASGVCMKDGQFVKETDVAANQAITQYRHLEYYQRKQPVD